MNIQLELGELCDICSGQIISRIVAKDGEESHAVKVIVPKAITENGRINISDVAEEKISYRRKSISDSNFAKAGDIVIKFSTPYEAALITETDIEQLSADGEEVIIPSFCGIIRINSQKVTNRPLATNYLLAFLNSDVCKQQYYQFTSGRVLAMMTASKMRNIKITLPDPAEQKRIGDEYMKSVKRVEKLKEIIIEEKKLQKALIADLINDYSDHRD